MTKTPWKVEIPATLKQRRPFILGHRGCKALAPENTLSSFRLALEHGADVIETDLRLTKDRTIICMHDPTVDRTTNGRGRVDQMNWTEIESLCVRGNSTNSHRIKVPSLRETLSQLDSSTHLALELKEPAFRKTEDFELLLRILGEADALDRVLVMSLSRKILECANRVGVPFPLAHIALLRPWPSAKYPFVGAWWPLLFLNPLYVAISHRQGQLFAPLDPNPEPRLAWYLWLDVDALLSDNPLRTRQELERLTRNDAKELSSPS